MSDERCRLIGKLQEEVQSALDGLAEQRDAHLAAIDSQIDGIRTAEAAAKESRRSDIDVLSERLAKAKELASAIENMGKFIDAVRARAAQIDDPHRTD